MARRRLPLLRGRPQGAPRAAAATTTTTTCPPSASGPEAEQATISGAIRTDFILSAEIMVISLKEVVDEPLVSRAVILVVVAVVITVIVYGLVAAIVKMDDVGLSLTQRRQAVEPAARPGPGHRHARRCCAGCRASARRRCCGSAATSCSSAPTSSAGTGPTASSHDLEHRVHDAGPAGGVLEWLVNTAASAALGLALGIARRPGAWRGGRSRPTELFLPVVSRSGALERRGPTGTHPEGDADAPLPDPREDRRVVPHRPAAAVAPM